MIFAGLALAAQQLGVEADVEKRTVAVGEPFLLQIRIDGSDAPIRPDLSGLADFSVEELGSQQTSSESVTVVEGNRVRREARRGRVYSYRLAARRAGTLTIPAIPVAVGGRQLRTAPIPIRVLPPAEDPDLKLRMTLSSNRLYVGEPAVLTLTWFIGRAVRDFRLDLPFLADRRLRVADPPVRFDPARHVEIAAGGTRVLAEKGTGRINGREMATLTLRKILIPLEPGSLALAPATVAGEVVRGSLPRRAPSLFDELFGEGFLEFGREPLLESFSVASGSLRVEVRPLPEAGRPAGFTGLVGDFRLEAQARPTEVTVGDPITLTLRVSGPAYVGHVELPPLARQPGLARDFKVPQEAPFGELEDGAKKFTEIVRVMNPGVSRIPPIELAYFNPRTGRYEVARTEPIPLKVREARIVTAQDAEGAGGEPAGAPEIASREGGIAHNYEGPEVLANVPAGPETWLESRLWLALILLPPLLYLSLVAARALARRRADESRQRAGGAFKRLVARLHSLEKGGSDGVYSVLLDGLRRYFRDRFGLPAGALTFRDLKPVLEERGVAPETIEAVGKLFERCEAGHYAGAPVSEADPPELVREALETAEKVERTVP
jgi:hypothetical protein